MIAPRRAHYASDSAVDALLRTMVTGGYERRVAKPGGADFGPLAATDRVDLCRHGEGIHAAGGIDALDEAIFAIAEMDPAEAGSRTIILERSWGEIGRDAA